MQERPIEIFGLVQAVLLNMVHLRMDNLKLMANFRVLECLVIPSSTRFYQQRIRENCHRCLTDGSKEEGKSFIKIHCFLCNIIQLFLEQD